MTSRVTKSQEVKKEEASLDNVKTEQKNTVSVLVTNAMKPVDVVKLDQEGKELLFDQKEEFLLIEDSLVAQLSRENKLRYHLAKQFHDTWLRSAVEQRAAAIEVDPEIVGSAYDKLNKMQVNSNLHTRWVRKDRLPDVLAKGYKILQAHEASTLLGAQGNAHTISQNGKTELVLVGIPKEVYEKRLRDKAEQNKKKAAVWEQSGATELEQLGATKGFVAKEESGRWNEIE